MYYKHINPQISSVIPSSANMNYEPTVETSLSVTITHNGRVSYFFPGTYQSTCRVYMTYFPFDHHTCYLRFASWIYDSSELDIRIRETGSIGSKWVSTNFWSDSLYNKDICYQLMYILQKKKKKNEGRVWHCVAADWITSLMVPIWQLFLRCIYVSS